MLLLLLAHVLNASLLLADVHVLLLSRAALHALLRNLAVILAIVAIAVVMTVVVVEKNAAGGNSGKIKIAVTNVINAIADAVVIPVVVADVTNVIAIAATKNFPNRNFYLN